MKGENENDERTSKRTIQTRTWSSNGRPVLFEDEIAEILATCGAGAKVLIYDLFPDATAYTYSGTYDKELTWKIYDALEEGLPVTINGKDITTM